MRTARVVITFSPPAPDVGAAIEETLNGIAEDTWLSEVPEDQRAGVLSSADAVLAWNITRELRAPDELALLRSTRLVQLLSAGVDRVPFDALPPELPVASNAGAYAAPMAEHVLAMALALAKRLPQNHAAMVRGEFDQQTPNRAIQGSLVGVLGFGGIGRASAKLFRAMGARVHALARSVQGSDAVDQFITMDDLDELLSTADIIVVALPLTRATNGLIGQRELLLMKPDAILVNVARGAIIDEDALYEHLRSNPSFSAGIDAWWREPRGGERFVSRHPFLELPNVLGSPHNSAIVAGSLGEAARQAAANIARALRGEQPEHLVNRSEYVG